MLNMLFGFFLGAASATLVAAVIFDRAMAKFTDDLIRQYKEDSQRK